LISRTGNRVKRFEALFDLLPAGFVLDGEVVEMTPGAHHSTTGVPLNTLVGSRRMT